MYSVLIHHTQSFTKATPNQGEHTPLEKQTDFFCHSAMVKCVISWLSDKFLQHIQKDKYKRGNGLIQCLISISFKGFSFDSSKVPNRIIGRIPQNTVVNHLYIYNNAVFMNFVVISIFLYWLDWLMEVKFIFFICF